MNGGRSLLGKGLRGEYSYEAPEINSLGCDRGFKIFLNIFLKRFYLVRQGCPLLFFSFIFRFSVLLFGFVLILKI